MNAVDGSEHFDERQTTHVEQSPSLLTVILDTNPAAWSLLSSTLTLSATVANLLVFINAHLAGNYTNKVAVLASHCDKAQWLYPAPTNQAPPSPSSPLHQQQRRRPPETGRSDSSRDQKPSNVDANGTRITLKPSADSGSKYRPFRLVEQEILSNLTSLLRSTTSAAVSASTSTMIAGALTMALTYINRESLAYNESLTGPNSTTADTSTNAPAADTQSSSLQSRILLINASPSTDLAHQYIPIMNAIFACQRLSIPIDILQIPLPPPSPTRAGAPSASAASGTPASDPSAPNTTVFLQQASDATAGIFIPLVLPPKPDPPTASQIQLTYLLNLLPTPTTRMAHLVLPTSIAVDFRAACFCHRNVVSTGFVCSICLSIFCAVPENAECLTCGTVLDVKGLGRAPVVVGRRKKRRAAGGSASAVGTPR